MKKYLLLLVIFASSCTSMPKDNNFNNIFNNSVMQSNETDISKEHNKYFSRNIDRNEKCMEMFRFKVFQVFEGNYALANTCETQETLYCYGAVVLLTPQRNVEYYDDMYISLPAGKCAVQDGVYRYETNAGISKTVPIIRFEYEYDSSSEEELLVRFDEYIKDVRYECKLRVANNKKYNTMANIKKCDCVADFLKDILLESKYENEEEFKNAMEKKCGKLPDI